MGSSERIRSFLNDEFLFPIRDPLWRHIYLSEGLKHIVGHRRFQKLTGIRQLGPTFLAYPGATHTRFNHSLGVYELAKRTLTALLRSEISRVLSLDGVKAFLCAALLHDLGHFPYAHSLKELPLKDHEQLTGEFILSTELASIIQNDVGADPTYVAGIIDLSQTAPDDESLIYREILSGVLDPDKLDYLNRDAFFCGIPYGIQDIDFVLSKIGYKQNIGMTIDESGLTAVENVLFSKYLMYRTVYWHKTVRAATAMIKKAVFSAMSDGSIQPGDLYGLDDEDFTRRFIRPQHESFRLIEDVAERRLHVSMLEIPVAEAKSVVDSATNLESRSDIEYELARTLMIPEEHARTAVIIDIPEPISFEADLVITSDSGHVSFTESGTVFNRNTVDGFTQSLRRLRIFIDPDYCDAAAEAGSDLKSLILIS